MFSLVLHIAPRSKNGVVHILKMLSVWETKHLCTYCVFLFTVFCLHKYLSNTLQLFSVHLMLLLWCILNILRLYFANKCVPNNGAVVTSQDTWCIALMNGIHSDKYRLICRHECDIHYPAISIGVNTSISYQILSTDTGYKYEYEYCNSGQVGGGGMQIIFSIHRKRWLSFFCRQKEITLTHTRLPLPNLCLDIDFYWVTGSLQYIGCLEVVRVDYLSSGKTEIQYHSTSWTRIRVVEVNYIVIWDQPKSYFSSKLYYAHRIASPLHLYLGFNYRVC